MVDQETVGQAQDEIADAQMAMDPTRSECVRPTILDHYHRWMRARSASDKYWELDSLIRACQPHISDPQVARDVQDMLENQMLRDSPLKKNSDMFLSGRISQGGIEVDECWRRYPMLGDIWNLVQKDLVRSGLLPWAMQYPDKILRSAFMQEIVNNIETLSFEQEELPPRPIRELPEQPRPRLSDGRKDPTQELTDLLLRDSAAKKPLQIDIMPAPPPKPKLVIDPDAPVTDADPEEGLTEAELDQAAEQIKKGLRRMKEEGRFDRRDH